MGEPLPIERFVAQELVRSNLYTAARSISQPTLSANYATMALPGVHFYAVSATDPGATQGSYSSRTASPILGSSSIAYSGSKVGDGERTLSYDGARTAATLLGSGYSGSGSILGIGYH